MFLTKKSFLLKEKKSYVKIILEKLYKKLLFYSAKIKVIVCKGVGYKCLMKS